MVNILGFGAGVLLRPWSEHGKYVCRRGGQQTSELEPTVEAAHVVLTWPRPTKHSNLRWISHQCRYHVVVLQSGRASHTPNWTIFPILKKPSAKPNLGRSSEPRPVHIATSEKRLYHGTSSTLLPSAQAWSNCRRSDDACPWL